MSEDDRGAAGGGGFDPDGAAHEVDELAADGEAEAAADVDGAGTGGALDEGAEEAVGNLGVDTGAGVFDGEFEDGDGGVAGGSGSEADAEGDRAGGGEFECVFDEVVEDLAEAEGIGFDDGGDAGFDDGAEGDRAGAAGEGALDALEEGGDFERLEIEKPGSGLVAGVIEDAIEEAEEVFAALADDVEDLALGVVERIVEEEIGEFEDGAERGADFVAHGGEEAGGGGGVFLGFLFGAGEGAAHVAIDGDVAELPAAAGVVVAGVVERGGVDADDAGGGGSRGVRGGREKVEFGRIGGGIELLALEPIEAGVGVCGALGDASEDGGSGGFAQFATVEAPHVEEMGIPGPANARGIDGEEALFGGLHEAAEQHGLALAIKAGSFRGLDRVGLHAGEVGVLAAGIVDGKIEPGDADGFHVGAAHDPGAEEEEERGGVGEPNDLGAEAGAAGALEQDGFVDRLAEGVGRVDATGANGFYRGEEWDAEGELGDEEARLVAKARDAKVAIGPDMEREQGIEQFRGGLPGGSGPGSGRAR